MSTSSSVPVEGKLLDFDWQIRHVMGSSTLKSLEDTLTQVTFHIQEPSSSPTESNVRNIIVEFSKNELKDLVSSLRSALKNLSALLTMGLSETDEVFQKHQQLCADLNLDKEVSKTSWSNYLATKHNYTLEGNQLHWLACALYVACRKSTVPVVGRVNTFIEGNLVSLTPILRACELTLIHFIDKCRKWASMVGLTTDFRHKIDALERKFAVSSVIFKKFNLIFKDMFDMQNGSAITDPDKMKVAKKGNRIPCSASRLMEYSWTLYLVVKSEFSDINDDLVSSYHLLLACCDLIYANAVASDRRDILNRNFIGIPEHFFDDDYDPPVEPICIIDDLCRIHEGISIDAKSVREYSWKAQVKKLFEKGILEGDAVRFTEILNPEVFDKNFRCVNKSYEQYVLSMGDFDERVMLVEHQTEIEDRLENPAMISTTTSTTSVSAAPAAPDPESELSHNDKFVPATVSDRAPSIIHPNTLTPLTGRQYLKNRDGNICAGTITPMSTAKECVIRIHTMLKSNRVSFRKSLRQADHVNESAIAEIENEIRGKVSQMISVCDVQCDDGRETEFSRKRLEVAEKLFYKMLDDIAQEEVKMGKPDVSESLRQDLFLRTLFACAVEIVVYSYGCSQFTFPWVLNKLSLPAYHFYKIIELVVRTENQLSRDMVKHLNMLEEKILDSMSWESNSPLWATIEESNMSVPLCEEVCLPHQLSSLDSSTQRTETLNALYANGMKGNKVIESKAVNANRASKDGIDGRGVKPKRGGSLGLFFRKFYHLASVRMQDLCEQLNISSKEVRLKIWTCFEYVIVHSVKLMKNRHLDQILMCTVYVACKVLEIDLTFQEIMKCYRNQPQSASHIYRSVLLAYSVNENGVVHEERGDLIKFYNSVYVKVIQNFALKFASSKSSNNKGEQLMLSPLPVSRSKANNSPYRRVSDKHSIYIRCLDNGESVAPSPVKPLSYYFSRSPAKDLHAINNMIQISAVKRSLASMEDDDNAIKKVCSRNDSSKLQDMIEDRRNYMV